MDTKVAYWTEDANGNLTLFNQNAQKLTTVPVAQAASYISAYSQGDPRAIDIGRASTHSTPQGSGGGGGGSGGARAVSAPTWAQQQGVDHNAAALAEQQRQFNETFGYNKARGDQQMQLQQAQLELEKQKRIDALHGPQDYIKYWRASRGLGDSGGAPVAGGPAGASAASAASPAASGAPNWSAAFQNVKTGVPAGAQTISDAPGGPAWAWNAAPSAGYNFGVQSIMPKSATIALSGLPDQTKPVSLSDWATQQMKLGGIKF